MPPIVRFEAVGVTRGATVVLSDVDLDVAEGEAVGVTGPNGTGKTTLLRVAATLLVADHGTATVLGATVGTPAGRRARPGIGLVGHQPALSPHLTLHENLAFYADLAGLGRGEVDRALDAVGLAAAANLPAHAASAGMARRADLARVVMADPRLLLLDEPDAGLDADATTLVDALVDRTKRRGGAALVVSHDAARVGALCDRVVRISGGRVATT